MYRRLLIRLSSRLCGLSAWFSCAETVPPAAGRKRLNGSPSDKDKLLNLAFAAQAELVFQLDDATWEVAL